MPNIKKITRQEYLKKMELLFAVIFSLFLITKFTSQTYAAAPAAAPTVAAVADSTWDTRYAATTNKAKSSSSESYKWYVDSSNVLHIGRGTLASISNATALAATSVIIDQKVTAPTSMRNFFASLKATTITGFENLDSSKTTNMSQMFYNTFNIVGLDLSKLNTSAVTDMRLMFAQEKTAGTSSLTGLRLNGKFVTTNVLDLSGMFKDLGRLDTIEGIDSWNVSKSMGFISMFDGTGSLTSIDLSKWRPTAATSMYSMFSESSVTKIDGALWGGTPNLTDTGNMFSSTTVGGGNTQYIDLRGLTMNKVVDSSFMFNNQGSLTTLNTTGWNLSSVSNATNMFRDVSSLTSLDVSTYGMGNATNLQSMFNGMNSITALNVTNWNVSKVTNMSFMFNYTFALTTADFSKWRPNAVTDMGSMFQNSNVTKVDGALWGGTPNLTTSSYMFNNSKGLPGATYIDLRGMTMNKVVDSSFMFNNQGSLTTLNTTGWVLSSVIDVTAMFKDVSQLTTLDVSTYGLGNATTLQSIFSGMNSVTALNVSNWDVSKVTNFEFAFNYTKSLSTVDVSKWKPNLAVDMGSMFQSSNVSVFNTASWGGTPNLTDTSYMFNNSNNLSAGTNFNLTGMTMNKVTDTQRMFAQQANLTTLNTTGWVLSADLNARSMFTGVSSVKTLDVSTYSMASATTLSYMFSGMKAVTALNVTNFNVTKSTTLEGMFSNDSALTVLDVSKWVPTAVTNTHDMFSMCTNIVTLDLTSWNTPNLTNMRAMFNQSANSAVSNDSSLKTVTFGPNFNASKVTDIGWLFTQANSLTSTNIGSLNFDSLTAMDVAFTGSGLTSLSITNWLDSTPTITSSAFSRMPNLTSLDISGLNLTGVTDNTPNILYLTSKLQTFTAGTKTKFYAPPSNYTLWSAFSDALDWETGNFVLSTNSAKVFTPGTAYNYDFSTAPGKYIREENNTVEFSGIPSTSTWDHTITESSAPSDDLLTLTLNYTNTLYNTGTGVKLVLKLSSADTSDFQIYAKMSTDTTYKELTTSGVTMMTSSEKVWKAPIKIDFKVVQRSSIKPKDWTRDFIYELSKAA